jgi:hypothetical protein
MENGHKGIIHLKDIKKEISLKIQRNLKHRQYNSQNQPIQTISNHSIPLLFVLPLNFSPTTKHNLHQFQINRREWQINETRNNIGQRVTQNQQEISNL